MRFPNFEKPWVKTFLSKYLIVSPLRNKDNIYNRNDVLSVSGELGIVNQIELLGRSYAGESLLPYHIVEKDDIVYTKSPLAEYPYGIIKTNRKVPGIVSTLYAVYKSTNLSNNRFVEHYFSLKSRTNNYLKPIVRIGAKHDMKIGNEEVLKNYVVFPAVEEQSKIADFLDILDKRISTQSKIIEDLNIEKKIISDKIFSQTPLRKDLLCSFYNKGKAGGTPKSTNKKYYDGDVPFLSISDMTEQGKYLYTTQRTLTQEGLANSTAWIVPGNSLILSMYASVGQVAINKIPLATSQAMFSMTLKDNSNLDFLYYYLSYFRENKLHKYLETGTQSNINADFVKGIEIPYYGENKNKQIVSLLSLIDERIQKEKDILSLYKRQKAYLLANMFI